MSSLVMVITKFGRFVGKEHTEKNNNEKRVDLKSAIEVVTVNSPKGPMVSGAIVGDMLINDLDIVIYLDSKSTYYNVYHQCVSDIVLAGPKSIITGK